MPSTTRIVRTARLATDEEIASVVLRLMMAMNDIGVANDALQEWDQTQSRKKKARQNGGKLYFGRIQMPHIYEALLIIEEIKQTASLVRAVERCDIRTQRSFEAVATFLYTEDFKRLRRLRNNAAFHYDSKLGLRALHQIIEKYPGDTSSLSWGAKHWIGISNSGTRFWIVWWSGRSSMSQKTKICETQSMLCLIDYMRWLSRSPISRAISSGTMLVRRGIMDSEGQEILQYADKLYLSAMAVLAVAEPKIQGKWNRDPKIIGLTILGRSLSIFKAALLLARARLSQFPYDFTQE
jgi:hypothetical protein